MSQIYAVRSIFSYASSPDNCSSVLLLLTAMASAFCWARATLAIRLERASLSTTPINVLTMLDMRNPIFWLIGVIALAITYGAFSGTNTIRINIGPLSAASAAATPLKALCR